MTAEEVDARLCPVPVLASTKPFLIQVWQNSDHHRASVIKDGKGHWVFRWYPIVLPPLGVLGGWNLTVLSCN